MAGLRDLGREYPIDDALNEGLIGKDCYDRPEECRYLLWSYEEHLAEELGAAATVDEHAKAGIWKIGAADSIEHIFPQTPTPAWATRMRSSEGPLQPVESNVGRIGNLLLLPIQLNQEAQNFPFVNTTKKNKKEIYSKHSLRMVQEVCKESDWTLAEIEAREAKIVAWARKRWSDV